MKDDLYAFKTPAYQVVFWFLLRNCPRMFALALNWIIVAQLVLFVSNEDPVVWNHYARFPTGNNAVYGFTTSWISLLFFVTMSFIQLFIFWVIYNTDLNGIFAQMLQKYTNWKEPDRLASINLVTMRTAALHLHCQACWDAKKHAKQSSSEWNNIFRPFVRYPFLAVGLSSNVQTIQFQ